MLTKTSLESLGLRTGRIRSHEIGHNVGWYSANGCKLGWGDLDEGDFKNVLAKLPPGEALIILGERDSYWHFVKFEGNLIKKDLTEENPPMDYIVSKFRYFFFNGVVYVAKEYGAKPFNFCPSELISREDAEKLFNNYGS